MGIFVRLKANTLDNTGVTLVDGATSTGYKLRFDDHMGGMFGIANPVALFAESIDQAPTKIGEAPTSRVLTMQLRVFAASQDALVTKLRALTNEVRLINRFKGRLRLRAGSLTYPVELIVEHAEIGELWSNLAETGFQQDVELTLTCQPLALMDPMDLEDDFTTNTLGTGGIYNNGGADWVFDAGSSDTSISGGALSCSATLTTERRLYHTGAPYEYVDAQTTIQVTVGTGAETTGFKAGVIVKRIDASNYAEVYVDHSAGTNRLRIDTIVAGVRTNRASTNLAADDLNEGNTVYVRGITDHNTIYADFIGPTGRHVPIVAPAYTTTATSWELTSTDEETLGILVRGRVGIVLNPQSTGTTISRWDVKAYAYRYDETGASELVVPRNMRLNGAIPGDAPALVDWRIIPESLGASSAYRQHALLAWTSDAGFGSRNLLDTPLGSAGSGTYMTGWNVSAVTGVVGAATSRTPTLGLHKYGMVLQVVTPATSGTGANRLLSGTFRKGVLYTAKALIKNGGSGGSTTATRISLGINGDITDGSTTNLSASWQEISVTWTPTETYNYAYVAVKIGAATATTMYFTNVRVYEGETEPDYWEAANIPFGLVQGEAHHAMQGLGYSTLSSANYMNGSAYGKASGTLASLTFDPSYYVEYLFHPWAMQPNSGREIAVEVWAQIEVDSARTDLRIPVWVTRPSDSTFNQNGRFSVEYGKTGKRVKAPSAGTVRKFTFLGTVVFECDPYSRNAQSLRLGPASAISGGSFAIDYLILAPAGSRVSTVTGVASTDVDQFLTGSVPYAEVRSDLSTYNISASERTGEFVTRSGIRGPALIGSPIEFQPGREALVVAKWGEYVIDQTDSYSTSEDYYQTGSMQFSVTPRVDLWADT